MATNGTDSKPDIQALATHILNLTKEPQPANYGFGIESELMIKTKELLAAIQSPMEHATSVMQSLVEASTIRTLLSLKALQAIRTSGSISLSDLEGTTGAQAALLERLLRVLVCSGFLLQNENKSYSHTPLSQTYATGIPGAMLSFYFDEILVMANLPDYFKARGPPAVPDGEKATTHNPSTWYHGQEGKTVFEIIHANPEKTQNFQMMSAMVGKLRPFTGFYDFGKLAADVNDDRPVLVDVGGADGTTTAKILDAHPEIQPEQCIVQDLSRVAELGKHNAAVPKGVNFQVHDFFTPQPIRHARAYHLRAICHDWSDTMVIKILTNIAGAMAPDSKLLIADVVLSDEGPGAGMAALMDMMMLCIGGKERTKANFEMVLDAAGLKVEGIYPAPGTLGFSIVAARLK